MESFTQNHGIFILLLWTVSCVASGQREVPTANLTTAPKAAMERSLIHFICKVTGSPIPNITWYKNDKVLTVWDRIEIFPLSGGEFLRLGPLRKYRHVGDYYCKASNEVGTATSQTVSLAVYRGVQNLPPGFPRIMKNPSGQSIYTGDDARYECNATGNPTPMISWMVDRFPLNLSNPRYSIPSRGVLTVANIQPEDHGIAFECVAANINGMVYSRRTRLIHKARDSKPVITSPPQPVTVDPETVVYLNCSARGLPPPAILWERDGKPFTSAETTDGVLVIPNIRKSGNYTCVAENSFGTTRASAYVTVRSAQENAQCSGWSETILISVVAIAALGILLGLSVVCNVYQLRRSKRVSKAGEGYSRWERDVQDTGNHEPVITGGHPSEEPSVYMELQPVSMITNREQVSTNLQNENTVSSQQTYQPLIRAEKGKGPNPAVEYENTGFQTPRQRKGDAGEEEYENA